MPRKPPCYYNGTLDPQILTWRKRAKRFTTLKKQLIELLCVSGFDKEKARVWLHTPRQELKGKTPKQLLVPIYMVRLVAFAKMDIDRSSTQPLECL